MNQLDQHPNFIDGTRCRASHFFQRTFQKLVRRGASALLLPLLFAAVSCALTPLPPLSLAEPGWTIQRGQAVWRRQKDAPEIAGDLLAAFHPSGAQIVQFTKTPFPLLTAQRTARAWQLEYSVTHQVFRGRGNPPARIVWFELLRSLEERPLGSGWHFENRQATSSWRLENLQTGESLAGYFTP